MTTEQIKDLLSTLSREEMEELYAFLGKKLAQPPPPVPQPPTPPTTEPAEAATTKVEAAEAVLAPLPPGTGAMQDMFREDPYSAGGAECDQPAEATPPPAGGIALNQAKNVLQQYHQTYVSPLGVPQYELVDSHKGLFGFGWGYVAAVTVRAQIGAEPVVIKSGRHAKRIDAEKDAALRACAYLMEHEKERFGALKLPRAAFSSSSSSSSSSTSSVATRPGTCQPKYGLVTTNAPSYLMHCLQIRALDSVVREEPVLSSSGGFVGKVVVVAAGMRHEFKNDTAFCRKKDAQLDADLKAAIWVRENIGVPVPNSMAVP